MKKERLSYSDHPSKVCFELIVLQKKKFNYLCFLTEGMTIQPYYDEDNIAEASDFDDSDFNAGSGDEIVMLEKFKH